MSRLRLAPDLTLPPDAITQTFGILAVRGAGKSNAAAVMAEEMFAAKLPFIAIDPVGSWFGLRSSGDGTGPGLPIAIFGGRHGDVPLERAGGALLADLVVEHRLSCVLDVTEFSEGDKIRFLTDFAERLYRRNEAPLHLFLEEADDYLPQRPMRDQARCLGAWERIVRRGRARGLGITLITQRSAVLNKNVLTQIETLLVLRTTSPQDRKAIAAWVEYHGQSAELLESLPGLEDGEAWVWSPHWLKFLTRVRIRRRETYDSGATPKAQAHRAPATLADVDLGVIRTKMAATIERAKAEDPRELRRQVAELTRALANRMPPPAPKETRVEIPVLTAAQVKALEAAVRQLDKGQERLWAFKGALQDLVNRVVEAGTPIVEQLRVLRVGAGVRPVGPGQPSAPRRSEPSPPRPDSRLHGFTRSMKSASPATLPIGKHRVLTAIAQHGDAGVTREQLSVLTGYKRSSRDTYVQQLQTAGLVIVAMHGQLLPTKPGLEALGPDFEPLPTGDALREHWLARLPEGERKILQVLVEAYPKPVDREAIDEATGYRRSSRDTYLQKLAARKLVVSEGRGAVRAAEELFG